MDSIAYHSGSPKVAASSRQCLIQPHTSTIAPISGRAAEDSADFAIVGGLDAMVARRVPRSLVITLSKSPRSYRREGSFSRIRTGIGSSFLFTVPGSRRTLARSAVESMVHPRRLAALRIPF
jgi:hypothetical protein